MRAVVTVLIVCVATALAGPARNGGQRIVGGDLADIEQYPFAAAMLSTLNFIYFQQSCGGAILNERSILSAAHCYTHAVADADRWLVRVGSEFAHSGGELHSISLIVNHPDHNEITIENDIAVVRLASNIVFNDVVQQGRIAGPSYFPPDDSPIWAIGWGLTSYAGSSSEELRHVELKVVNQALCASRYNNLIPITDNMICHGLLDTDGKGICSQDSGGPTIHNDVIVGVISFGSGCGEAQFPGVSARVSQYTDFILANV